MDLAERIEVDAISFIDGGLPSPQFVVSVLTINPEAGDLLDGKGEPRQSQCCGGLKLLRQQRLAQASVAIKSSDDATRNPLPNDPLTLRYWLAGESGRRNNDRGRAAAGIF